MALSCKCVKITSLCAPGPPTGTCLLSANSQTDDAGRPSSGQSTVYVLHTHTHTKLTTLTGAPAEKEVAALAHPDHN